MLVPIKRFIDTPILSLQTGSELAKTSKPIIDPRKLKIVALRVSGKNLDTVNSVLHPEDIREISDVGLIVDNSDRLMSTEGLVRLQEVIDFKFELNGIRVEDEKGHKLGTVKDYVVDPDSFIIQQLYVQPPLMRSLSISVLTIRRTQITSINNQRIIVKSTAIKEEPVAETVKVPFVNPFRSPAPTQPESKQF